MLHKVKNLGQVYTPNIIVSDMLKLRKNTGTVLEPSSGDGAFSNAIKDIVSIEIDADNKSERNLIMDFFDYSIDNKFDTVIGNPPYVAYKHILEESLLKIKKLDYLNQFDNRTNLYLYFVRKCLEHLNDNGELIFVTPRNFIKTTSSIELNKTLYDQGTITHWNEYGDETVFKGYSPTVAVWRFEKNNFSRITKTKIGDRKFNFNNGQISFTSNDYDIKFSDLFFVKVGAASGSDKLFTHENGNMEFVCSHTKTSGLLRRMYYNKRDNYIDKHKDFLINRKIKAFTEDNWWHWGRGFYQSNQDRIYVNCKTRDKQPFFTNDCKNYDGSVLAIFPKVEMDINKAIQVLNNIDWNDLGFLIGNRYCFSQKALENSCLISGDWLNSNSPCESVFLSYSGESRDKFKNHLINLFSAVEQGKLTELNLIDFLPNFNSVKSGNLNKIRAILDYLNIFKDVKEYNLDILNDISCYHSTGDYWRFVHNFMEKRQFISRFNIGSRTK